MSTINLLPDDYLQQRSQQRANVLCLILFGIVMIGVITAAIHSEEQASQVRVIQSQVAKQYREAGEMIAQMQELEDKKKAVLSKAQMAAELLERVPRSYLLASLTNALPEGSSLVQVKLMTAQAKPLKAKKSQSKFKRRAAARKAKKGASESAELGKPLPLRVTLEVAGLAETDVQVAQFMANMKANPLIKSVELEHSELEELKDGNARSFKVVILLKSDAHVEILDKSAPATVAATGER